MRKQMAVVLAAASLTAAAFGYGEAAERKVPYPPTIDWQSTGASSYNGAADAKNSPYFPKIDFYAMKSNTNGLTILNGYPTYQQTTETTCGPAAALTVLEYLGNRKYDEFMLSILMKTLNKPEKDGQMGTSTSKMVSFFKSIGWKVESSLDRGTKPESFAAPEEFRSFVLKNLKSGTPIMVENMYWGGHWRVIIGYDTMGTAKAEDDVLIFADSYDVLDHLQDGYTVEAAQGFFYTWKDMEYLPKNERVQQWITAHP